MKVKDLMFRLSHMPQEADVLVRSEAHCCCGECLSGADKFREVDCLATLEKLTRDGMEMEAVIL